MRYYFSLLCLAIGLGACSAKVDTPAISLPSGGSSKVVHGPFDAKKHAPAAGSYVVYDGKAGDQTYHEESRNLRLNQDNIWVISHFVKTGEKTITNEQDYRSGLYSSNDYARMMDTCERWGGAETITVVAGVFRACKVTVNGDITWYGNVPIDGIVKFQRKDGATAELTDMSYGPANPIR